MILPKKTLLQLSKESLQPNNSSQIELTQPKNREYLKGDTSKINIFPPLLASNHVSLNNSSKKTLAQIHNTMKNNRDVQHIVDLLSTKSEQSLKDDTTPIGSLFLQNNVSKAHIPSCSEEVSDFVSPQRARTIVASLQKDEVLKKRCGMKKITSGVLFKTAPDDLRVHIIGQSYDKKKI